MTIPDKIDAVFIRSLLAKSGNKLNPMLLRLHGDEVAQKLGVARAELPAALYNALNGTSQPRCIGGNLAGAFHSFSKGYVGSYCKVNDCACRLSIDSFSWRQDKEKLTRAREKTKQTNLQRYGEGAAAKNEDVKKKIAATNMQRYGVPCNLSLSSNRGAHMKTTEGKEKFAESCRRKHGVSWSSQIPGVMQKAVGTKRERYGKSLMPNPEAAHKKAFGTKFDSFANTIDGRLRLANLQLLEDFRGVKSYHRYHLQCACGKKFYHSIRTDMTTACPTCFPRALSAPEEWLAAELDAHGISYERRNRRALQRKEIDFLIGDVGIEINGLYWHGEQISGESARLRHLRKKQQAGEVGIKLIQFFEDEISEKPDIVASMVLSKIGASKRIMARKLQCSVIDNGLAHDFYKDNHIHGGGVRGGMSIGLMDGQTLVAALTVRRGFKKRLEISRCAFLKNTVVVGGLGRLVKKLMAHVQEDVFTFCDGRFGDALSWRKAGFAEIGKTQPGYFYVKNGKRYNRQHFQKHKLAKKLTAFDPQLSEWENMKAHGYDRVWDCGHYLLKLSAPVTD